MKNKNFFYFNILFAFVLMLAIPKQTKAQVNVNDSVISSFIVYVSYAYQIPGGDMADRFGNNSTIGPGFTYKTDKNWMFSIEGNYIFGNGTKNSDKIIADIATSDGFVISLDGTYTNIRPLEQGFTILGKVGKVIPVFDMNPNSGLVFNLGTGYIQHKISWDVEGNNAPQLAEDYKKGYDRFTEGLSLSQSVGLFYIGESHLWNFKVEAEVIESFTKTKRYNFDTHAGEPENRLDLFYGLKVSWMIPLYGRAPKDIYFY